MTTAIAKPQKIRAAKAKPLIVVPERKPLARIAPNVLGQHIADTWAAYHGDCVEVVKALPDASIHYWIFSPPFASLYTYSNSARDMGNSLNHSEFYEHFRFLARDLLRVTKPGRLLSFHCMDLPTSKTRDGFIGITDFRGLMIKIFQDAGWIFHSSVCIWKDPVTAMQRTKALGLLHKQIVKDSCMSRQGIPDFLVTMVKPIPGMVSEEFDVARALEAMFPPSLVTMRRPGENDEPVSGMFDRFIGKDPPNGQREVSPTATEEERQRYSIDVWQRYASPVWMDIDASNTLQYTSAREENDERHICPLQLDVIGRGIEMWSNPGDIVGSPFAGIGSEGHVALGMGRRFIGAELKASYYEQAARNLKAADPKAPGKQLHLFG